MDSKNQNEEQPKPASIAARRVSRGFKPPAFISPTATGSSSTTSVTSVTSAKTNIPSPPPTTLGASSGALRRKSRTTKTGVDPLLAEFPELAELLHRKTQLEASILAEEERKRQLGLCAKYINEGEPQRTQDLTEKWRGVLITALEKLRDILPPESLLRPQQSGYSGWDDSSEEQQHKRMRLQDNQDDSGDEGEEQDSAENEVPTELTMALLLERLGLTQDRLFDLGLTFDEESETLAPMESE